MALDHLCAWSAKYPVSFRNCVTPGVLNALLKITLYAVIILASLAANKPSIVATKSSSPLAILFIGACLQA